MKETDELFNLTIAQSNLFSQNVSELGAHFNLADSQALYLTLGYVVKNLGRSSVQQEDTVDNFHKGVKYMSEEVTMQDLIAINSLSNAQLLASKFFDLFNDLYQLNVTETASIFNLSSADVQVLMQTQYQDIIDGGPVLETSTVSTLMVHRIRAGGERIVIVSTPSTLVGG